MRGRADVGLGDVCIPDSSRGYHRSDTVALEYAIAGANRRCAAQAGTPVAERHRGGGGLNVTTKPILIIRIICVGVRSRGIPPATIRRRRGRGKYPIIGRSPSQRRT